MIVQLRSRCFWNTTSKRDVVDDISNVELARLISCDDSWLRIINAEVGSKTYIRQPRKTKKRIELAQLFFKKLEDGKGQQAPTYQVILPEPIAPQDEEAYQAALSQLPEGQLELPVPASDERLIANPEAHPVNSEHLTIDQGAQPVSSERLMTPNPLAANVSGNKPVNGEHESVNSERLIAPSTLAVNASNGETVNDEHEPVNGEHHVKHIKHLKAETPLREQQQKHAVTVNSDTLALAERGADNLAAATAAVLMDFGIGEPARSRIVKARPDPEWALAWCLYAALETGLDDDRLYGYVVNRLRANDEPDERFLRWARLTPQQWRALWQANRDTDWETLPPELQSYAREWREDFGNQWPAGPFGDQGISEEADGSEDQATDDDTGTPLIRLSGQPTNDDQDIVIPGCTLTGSEVWQTALSQLQMQMPRATFDTWVRQTTLLSFAGDMVIIGVHNGYAKDWLENRLHPLIVRTLTDIIGRAVGVRFTVWNKQEAT